MILVNPCQRGGCAFIMDTLLHPLKIRSVPSNLAVPALTSLHRLILAAPAQTSLRQLKNRCTRLTLAAFAETTQHLSADLAAPAQTLLQTLKHRCTRSHLAASARTTLNPHKPRCSSQTSLHKLEILPKQSKRAPPTPL